MLKQTDDLKYWNSGSMQVCWWSVSLQLIANTGIDESNDEVVFFVLLPNMPLSQFVIPKCDYTSQTILNFVQIFFVCLFLPNVFFVFF